MDLTQLTLEQFMCAGSCTCAPADANAFCMLEPLVSPLLGPKIRDLGKGYALHGLQAQAGNVALLVNGKIVGAYFGELLAVHPTYKGQRLAVPMVLAAVGARPIPIKRAVSPEGASALRRAWRVANGLEENPWP